MCQVIIYNNKELKTVDNVQTYFKGLKLYYHKGYRPKMITPECCLCAFDLPRTFAEAKINYEFDGIDTYEIVEVKKWKKKKPLQ
jgi:hypothetical protein